MKVWNFASGYVKINIMGEYPERIVNRALNSGIRVYDVVPSGRRGLECHIPMRGFAALRHCAAGCGCRIHILSKHGFACIWMRLRRERCLISAAVAAAFILTLALSRLWMINVDYGGADPKAVNEVLAGTGLHVGMPAGSVELSLLDKSLSSVEGIAASRSERHGVVLSIGIVTNDALNGAAAAADGDVSSSIYADKDCVIESITVFSGKAAVSVGDAVIAGTLLISGDLGYVKKGCSVAADGVVCGRVLYRASCSAERVQTENLRDGRSTDVNAFMLFGREYFFKMPYDAFELEPADEACVDACPLPLSVRRYRCYGLSPAETDIGEEAAGLLAAEGARGKLFDSIPRDARIVSLNTQIISEDGRVTAAAAAVVIEKIGRRREL